MRPLSSWNFFINNRRKVIPVVISISIGVFLLYFMYIIGDSVINTAEAGYRDTLSYFSLLYPQEEGNDEEILEQIRQNENVEKLLQAGYGQTNIRFMGSYSGTMVLFMNKDDLKDTFDKMNLKLKEGTMPTDENEIIMHWRIAANKGLKPGQYIGREVNDTEQFSGKYKISGIFDGNSQLCFGEEDISASNKIRVWMVQAKPGKIRQLNRFLQDIAAEKMGMSTLNKIEDEFGKNMQIVYVGSIFIEALIILVLCITIGNTTNLHFLQRKREFGILLAVGYKKRDILNKIFHEILNMIIAALAAGILFAILVGLIIKVVYMEPMGSIMNLFSIKYFLVTAILPVFVLISSILPAKKMLKHTDKISIIEG